MRGIMATLFMPMMHLPFSNLAMRLDKSVSVSRRLEQAARLTIQS
jgi:hypothetical protein